MTSGFAEVLPNEMAAGAAPLRSFLRSLVGGAPFGGLELHVCVI
jgi:hypothetical protein